MRSTKRRPIGTAVALGSLFVCLACPETAHAREEVVIGSKAFPESWILGEALTILAQSAGAQAVHRANLGGTEIVAEAARTGAIDAYPEYTGTLRQVVLHTPSASDDELRQALAHTGLGMTAPLGFDDSYALAVAPAVAERDSVRSLSDLSAHKALRAAFTHEFLARSDGWPGLRARYGIDIEDVRAMSHALAFDAIASHQADVVDVYTTDPQIARLNLRLLADDRGFFPRYEAVVVYRLDLATRVPHVLSAVERLIGRIDRETMARANGAVADQVPTQQAARQLLKSALGPEEASAVTSSTTETSSVFSDVLRHLQLVGASLLGAVTLGVPLGILAARRRRVAGVILATTGVLQTVPSLALLALLIPVLGIGAPPAMVALFLYALLPIVQGTYTGLTSIARSLLEAAEALGLPPATKLLHIELPLASPSIVAGVRTSAVIAVGTATIAALVGAGGLGDPILRGIALRSTRLILSGALPAAILALGMHAFFAGVERMVVPGPLAQRPTTPHR